MKILFQNAFYLFALAPVLLWGCSPKHINSGYRNDVPDEISRLIENKYLHSLHAVGTAEGANESLARNKAVMQARAELARQFDAEINALQKNYEEAVNDRPANEYSEVMEVFSSMKMSGSSIAKSMISRQSSDSYKAKVLVVISAEKLKELIDDKTHAYTSFRAMKAYKKLQERVEKEKEEPTYRAR